MYFSDKAQKLEEAYKSHISLAREDQTQVMNGIWGNRLVERGFGEWVENIDGRQFKWKEQDLDLTLSKITASLDAIESNPLLQDIPVPAVPDKPDFVNTNDTDNFVLIGRE
jgi:hypothetical protein